MSRACLSDSELNLVSDDFLQMDASKEIPKDPVSSKQDDSISVHGGTSISSGEKEQELPAVAVKESREEISKNWSLPPEAILTIPSEREMPYIKNIEMSVPNLVAPPPSLLTVTSKESFHNLLKESRYSMEKIMGETTGSVLDKAELEAPTPVNEEASPMASEEDSSDQLHSLMNCRICQLFVRTVDRLLDKSEEMMDQYMPLTEEEINNLKLAVEELDAFPAEHQRSACLDRITALSSRLRQRAYMMVLGKLRTARRSTHSNLSQLQQTLDLIEHAQQEAEFETSHEHAQQEPEFETSHEKLNEICSRWTQQRQSGGELPPYKQEEVRPTSSVKIEAGTPLTADGKSVEVEAPRDGNATEAGMSPPTVHRNTMEAGVSSAKDHSSDEAHMVLTVPGCREERGFPSTEVESKTLEMSRSLTLNLQGTYKGLLANLKDLPLNLKRKLYQTYQHMAELHARLTMAHSFADLPGSMLEKGLQFMVQAQESMDELMEFAFQNPMGMWAEDHPLAPVATETPSSQEEEGDILKIQAAYDPKGCDENDE